MFPQEVKVQALAACGRRCCICHKFTGLNIECHHIIPKSEKGEDTFENCIPLCFDCHANAGHYNPDHPKGTKYSSAELKTHRDNWYSMHSRGISPSAPLDYLELDKKLYFQLSEALGGSPKMLHFRDHDYGGGFSPQVHFRLFDFLEIVELPEGDFFDAQLSASLADLTGSIKAYFKASENRLWQDQDVIHIPPEWTHGTETMRNRFDKATDVMNHAATEVWKIYWQFVKTARLQLKV